MIIEAPAKLNLRLKVLGRRPDGYHELISVMVPVNLCDLIELRPLPEEKLLFSCEGYAFAQGEENLVVRAARAFFRRIGLKPRISIHLAKKVPVGAGLGGGSSDAAQTLKGLNLLFDSPLRMEELAEMGLGLGADVPFFIKCRPALASGIGEVLEPMDPWPELWYLIVTPALVVSTSWVYHNLKLRLTTRKQDYIFKVLRKKELEIPSILENDLEAVTGSRFPIIHEIKKVLVEAGAAGALMSGSGPSVFGVFHSQEGAVEARERLNSRKFGRLFVATHWSPSERRIRGGISGTE